MTEIIPKKAVMRMPARGEEEEVLCAILLLSYRLIVVASENE